MLSYANLKLTVLLLAAIAVIVTSIADCQAQGRVGGYRVGG